METKNLNKNQIEALNEVAAIDYGFATKVAKTVISNGWYSDKQATIINEKIAECENWLDYSASVH